MDLCLVTCNIRFDNPSDEANAWPNRREFLTDVLRSHVPDVIATQEGRYAQLMDMERLLPDHDIVDQHRSWIKERMYPSFFIRKDRFEVLGSEDLWLSETPEVAGSRSFESAFPRLLTWLMLQPKGGEERLLLVNTHLDHVKSSTRQAQAKVLAREVKKLWKGDAKLFILGDFNDSPDSEVGLILKEEFRGLKDSWKEFNQTEESSHHAFKGEMPTGSRIDWILTDGRCPLKGCRMDKISRDGLYPTDHFPVVCRLSI